MTHPQAYAGGAVTPSNGRVALTLAIITVVAGVGQLLASPFVFTLADLPGFAYGAISAGTTVAHTLLAAATLIVGIATARRGAPLHGGVAIGVGGSGVIAGIAALIGFPLLSLLLQV
ncbi:MAG: hypothetical protein ABI566_02010 [Pseudolysinimonas sp.]